MGAKERKEFEKMKPKIIEILKRHNVRGAGVFGSYARGEQTKDSDIDILIEVRGRRFSLLDLVGIELELKKELRRDVDLLTYKGISPYLKKSILEEEVRII
jgi:hypothetical protein